jgi:hypothetical protein
MEDGVEVAVDNHPTDLYVAKKMVLIHQSATARDIEFDMSFKEVKKLLTRKTCYFEPDVVLSSERDAPDQRTLDRLDNDKGYVDGNVVACSKRINAAKADLTISDIKVIHKGLKKAKLV